MLITDFLPVLIILTQQVPQHSLVALGIGQEIRVHIAHAADHGLAGKKLMEKRSWHTKKQ